MRILRPSVQRFAEAMEEQLRRNDFKGGWGHMNSYEILGRPQRWQTHCQSCPEIFRARAAATNHQVYSRFSGV